MLGSVKIALQVPGKRYTHSFPSNYTLWEILKYFEENNDVNLTQNNDYHEELGKHVYLQPSIMFNRKEVFSYLLLLNTRYLIIQNSD